MEESQAAIVVTASGIAVIDEELNAILAAHNDAVNCTWALLDAGNKWIEKAAKCGHLLIAKKASLGHGNFLPWLAENVKAFGYDTANDYMKAARYLDKCPNLEGEQVNCTFVRNLRQAVGILEDKPTSDTQEREKPAFVIRCSFNIEPEKLDEYQRKDAFNQARPFLEAFQSFGFIEIKA